MNAHHARQAQHILDRANRRSRNPQGREARAEKSKLADMPQPDATRLSIDDRPRKVVSPQSSWSSIADNAHVSEFMGEGFQVCEKLRRDAAKAAKAAG